MSETITRAIKDGHRRRRRTKHRRMVTITLWRCAAGDTPCADNTLPSATVPGSTPLHANSSGFHSDWFNLAPMKVQEATVQLAYFAAVRPYVRDISSRNTTTILLTVVSETDGRRNGGNGGSSTGGGDETHRDAESPQLPPFHSLVTIAAVPAVAAAQVFLLSNPPFSTPAAPPVLHPAALLRLQLRLLIVQLLLLTVLSEAGGGGGDDSNGGTDGHGGNRTTGDGGETDVGAESPHFLLPPSPLMHFSCASIGTINAAVYQR